MRKVVNAVITCLVCVLALNIKTAAAANQDALAQFEIKFLEFTIDHHFSALRMTELAAGTDPTRNPEISPAEGTSSTPGFSFTPAKASLPDIKSISRQDNRVQREEILRAQKFLKMWYGITYQPQVRPENQQQIDILEAAKPGGDFDHHFLEVFSRHHFTIVVPATACISSYNLKHFELKRYCTDIVNGQLSQIDEMRHLLCEHFGICDYRPLTDPDGRH